MMRALVAVCLAWALPACNVASVQELPSTIAQNQCTSDSECAGGSCSGGQCISGHGTFQTVLFEVTPPADETSIAGVQFLKRLDNLSLEGDPDLPIALDLVALVTGEVTLSPRSCTPKFDDQGTPLATAADPSVPALVSLIPSTRALGLFSPPAAAQATLTKSSYWAFSINVPPGNYDIYVEPKHQPDDSCVVPPELLRDQPIKGGTLNLGINMPVPPTFEFHVSWPHGDGALGDWSVDMLDPVSGRVISNRAQLALSNAANTDYVALLSYMPVVGDTSKVKAQELVRLSPPDGVTAPSVLLARSALSLFSADSGTLSQFTTLPTPVHIQGQVTARVTPIPVAATVTLTATQITGIEPGVLASFVRTVSAGDDGTFNVDVLPGTYRVDAAPSGNTDLAEATADWQIAASPSVQAGKVIELGDSLPINGTVWDPSRSFPAAGAQVQAVASPASVAADVLHQALGETIYVPHASTGTVDGMNGSFLLNADSGTFDFSVRPQPSTGFAWLVRPNVGVGTDPSNSAGPGLGVLDLPLPVKYHGTVSLPGLMGSTVQVPGALIRAYIYMKAGAYTTDPTQADSVLQIAETRSDDTGEYDLLIPAALNTP